MKLRCNKCDKVNAGGATRKPIKQATKHRTVLCACLSFFSSYNN